jgi:Uma2 family endonuclease
MSVSQSKSVSGEPVWEIAELFPAQGQWSESEYLRLNTNRLVEFSEGNLEILPMPTEMHQIITLFLYGALLRFVKPEKLGMVLVAPLRVRLWEGKFREPDVIFMSAANRSRRGNEFWDGADLVMEVVSEDDPDRDLVVKRGEYAKARILEYWIVDPRDCTIRVLSLDESAGRYVEAGKYNKGEMARSLLLDGFSVPVTDVFSQ